MQRLELLGRPATLLRTGALVRHNVQLLLREPGPLLSRLLLPLAFLVLLRPLYTAAQGRAEGTAQAAVGTLVTFSLLALSIVGSSILTERLARTWSRLRATAARPGEILTGKALPAMAVLILQQLAILGFAAVLGLRIDHPALLACQLLCWTAALLGLGAVLGVLARSLGELSAAYDLGGMLLSSMGGALVPLAALPPWVAAVAPVSPGYWAATGLRDALTGDTAGVLRACGVLLGVAVLGAALATARLCGRGGSARAVAL